MELAWAGIKTASALQTNYIVDSGAVLGTMLECCSMLGTPIQGLYMREKYPPFVVKMHIMFYIQN